jgi:purine-cytosine permease-like protein
MNVEWLVTGIFLFGGMIAAAISLYLKRRKESKAIFDSVTQSQPNVTEFKETDKER